MNSDALLCALTYLTTELRLLFTEMLRLMYRNDHYPYGDTEIGFLTWSSLYLQGDEAVRIYWDVADEESIFECPIEWSQDESHSES